MQGALFAGGSVGVNQNLFVSGVMSLTGSLTVTGDQGLLGSAVTPIQGDFRIRGPFTCQGVINIARNAWLGNDLIGSGILTVGGDLRQPAFANRDPAATITIGGSDRREPINLESPCACNDDQQLDIAAIIKEAESDNHNVEAGFDSNRFENVTGIETVQLPCGRFFLSRINVVGSLTLTVNGRSALFISGDLTASSLFSLVMGQDATLDVFIGGKLSLSSLQTFGALTRPANLRVYVAGDQPTTLSGLTTFVGSLYAPRSRVELGGIQTVCGSIFAGDFETSTSATTSILYDTSLLYQGDDCNPPPESCSRCDDCPATSACVEGKCGACRRDEDCCEPLRCFQGQCTVIVL